MAKSRPGSSYPADWPAIAQAVKAKASWRCERCGHTHHRESGHVLTVHHLDLDRSNCEEWNLAALCQKCHLSVQGRVDMTQDYLFEHSAWMQPHVEGRDKAIAEGRWPREAA